MKLGDRGQAYNTSGKNDSETHKEKSLVLILMNFAKERLKVNADRCASVYIVGMLYLHGIRREMGMDN